MKFAKKVIPILYHEKEVKPELSKNEKKAMKGEMELDVIEEPQDHLTVEDDKWLEELLTEKRKGPLEVSVILKDDMKDICKQVMAHWYNVKGKDFKRYAEENFDTKWSAMDNNKKGQIFYEEGKRFIKDFTLGII